MDGRRDLDLDTDQMIAYVEGGIGWMIYNNPARRNAISNAMMAAIPQILRTFQSDGDVRVIVVGGAGDKAFVSGRDINELRESGATPSPAPEALDRIWDEVEKPVIAMIRGYCLGAGIITALEADIRIADENAKFGVPLARLGRGAHLGPLEQLASVVGRAAAAEIFFSARHLSAEEALRVGLVNRVVPSDELEEAVRELGGQIAANAPLSLQTIKIGLRLLARDPSDRDTARLDVLADAALDSADFKEGRKAFLEKRPPVFQGF